ncbi:MAG: hypothetical protein COA42_11840 [Alteromonadaceae bacterium]|nr:MAG: hypothetical protein COA42_11840 [Alteromonadaceae bacterium]
MKTRRSINVSLVLLLTLMALLQSCSGIKPWVKPYERENIADPIMAFDRDPIDSKFMSHGFGNREAAIGAEGSGGGGCGCN